MFSALSFPPDPGSCSTTTSYEPGFARSGGDVAAHPVEDESQLSVADDHVAAVDGLLHEGAGRASAAVRRRGLIPVSIFVILFRSGVSFPSPPTRDAGTSAAPRHPPGAASQPPGLADIPDVTTDADGIRTIRTQCLVLGLEALDLAGLRRRGAGDTRWRRTAIYSIGSLGLPTCSYELAALLQVGFLAKTRQASRPFR